MPNPFAFSRWFHRMSNIFVAPMFRLLPMPRGFVLLSVTGRRSGRRRQRPVRAVGRSDTFYAVAILGERSDWLRNVRKEPAVRVKAGGRTRQGLAREVQDAAERASAVDLYVGEVVPYDYVDYVSVHWGWPTRRKIVEAHRLWAERGALVAIEMQDQAP